MWNGYENPIYAYIIKPIGGHDYTPNQNKRFLKSFVKGNVWLTVLKYYNTIEAMTVLAKCGIVELSIVTDELFHKVFECTNVDLPKRS